MFFKSVNYLLVGNGRLAKHFNHYFSLLGLQFDTWSRKKNSKEDLNLKVQKASHILLLITDSAIEQFAKENLQEHLSDESNKLIIHCSGALVAEGIIGAHPLQSFAKSQKYTLDEYKQVCFFYEKNALELEFENILPGLSNPNYIISADQKPYYHALCVGSNNFTTILWQAFAKRMLENFNVPFEKLKYYLNSTAKNLQKDLDLALTGPFARNDKKTIKANLDSLKDDDFRVVYKAFLDFYNLQKSN